MVLTLSVILGLEWVLHAKQILSTSRDEIGFSLDKAPFHMGSVDTH